MSYKFILIYFLFPILLYSQSDLPTHTDVNPKPDYRNRINIPEYDASLMPTTKERTNSISWTELNPKVPRVVYIGIHFINPDTGWAVGGNGAIIKTTDGGNYWETIESPITNTLLKVGSYNGGVVIVTGYDGIILRSENGGESFVQIPSGLGSGTDLWSVQMINDTLGWICGLNNTLLKTTDAGLTWQQINTGVTGIHYWSLDFLNEEYGMLACAEGKILKTINGGNIWIEIQAGDTRSLYTIDIIDSLHTAAAGGNGKNIYSSDQGITWTNNPDLPESTNWITFIDKDTGYSVHDVYQIRKTTNRGQNWFNPNTTNLGGEWHIQILEDGTGYSVGEGVKIFKQTEGLDNWAKLILNEDWSDVFFINEMTGFFISNYFTSGLYKTEDGGMSYEEVKGAPNGRDILFLDSLVGFIGSDKIYKTIDGGKTWYATNGAGSTVKILFISNEVGWACGGNAIYKTTDAGENWVVKGPGGNSFYFADSLVGWITRVNGRPYKTTNGGNSWIEQTNLNIWESRDVFFNNLSTGFILESNKFYETTDGGFNWVLNTGLTGFSVGAKFVYDDSNTIFIIGYKIFRSIDGGENWIDFVELTGIPINGLSILGSGFGYAVGNLGLILKYIDSSIVPVELINFSAELNGEKINFRWSTATELNNHGFEIQRKNDEYDWITIGFIEGNGTTTEKKDYNFVDNLPYEGENFYRLKQIDYNGNYEYSNIVEIDISIVSAFQLFQNYPNPFNPTTTINYSIPIAAKVNLTVYDILGNEIMVLVNEEKLEGRYEVDFNASYLPSGVYFYRLTTPTFAATKKMLIIR